jgi:acetylglutamate kinase
MEMNIESAKPIVVKIGGSTFGSGDTTVEDLVSLQRRGIVPVLVHGGGNRVTEWLGKMGISTSFVRGQRVTDRKTLDVVIAVLTGLVNKELVAAINLSGGKAIGISGIDGGLIQGRIESPDMGYMGQVIKVNTEPIEAILDAGYIPVVAPGGLKLPAEDDDPVMLLNINGDVTAGELARALKAEGLIFLTDVPGVCDNAGKLLPKLSAAEASALFASGVISGGMIPKVEACLRAREIGSSAQIIDGRSPHVLLAAIQDQAPGTKIQ